MFGSFTEPFDYSFLVRLPDNDKENNKRTPKYSLIIEHSSLTESCFVFAAYPGTARQNEIPERKHFSI